MTPLETMAKAIAKEDWGIGRAGGEWSDELWDRLLSGYREMQRDNPDIVEAHYLYVIFRKARAALLALADSDFDDPTILAGWSVQEAWDDRETHSGIDVLRAMLRQIAKEGE